MANDSNGKLSPTKVETIHLRVYIHCEGCKKKVRKILTNIEGVNMVEIDASLGKVTVTGTAEVKTILKKLEKSGKVVELWPAPQPIKLAPLTPQPKEDSKKKAKENNEKKGQPQPSPQKPPAAVDSAIKQDISNANSSKKQGAEGSEKKNQGGEDTAPSDQVGSKNASKKSCGVVGDDATKPILENKTKAKPVEANGDAKHSDGVVPSPSTNSNKKTNKTNNGGGAPNANDDTQKKSESDIANEIEGEKVVSPDNKSGDAEKGSNSSSKKKVGEGGKSRGVETNLDDLFIEASTSTSTANRHMAPPPMVLVETSEYSVDMESAEDYATHMFSDENANNCTLM